MSNTLEARRHARHVRHLARMEAAQAVVPHGDYCYSSTGRMRTVYSIINAQGAVQQVAPYLVEENLPCPFLKIRGDWPRQANGYCRLTKCGDSAQHASKRDGLLWDLCKSCGINQDDPDA